MPLKESHIIISRYSGVTTKTGASAIYPDGRAAQFFSRESSSIGCIHLPIEEEARSSSHRHGILVVEWVTFNLVG